MRDFEHSFSKPWLKDAEKNMPLPQPVSGGSNTAQPYTCWDSGYGYKGSKLGVRVSPGGSRAIIVRFSIYLGAGKKKQSKPTVMKLEEFLLSKLTVDQLRAKAHEMAVAAKGAKKTPGEIKAERRAADEVAQRLEEEELRLRSSELAAFSDVGVHYLDNIKGKHRGASTFRAKELAVERASCFFGDKPLSKLTSADGAAFLKQVVEDVKAASVARDAAETGEERVGGRAAGKYPGHQQAATTKSHIKQVLVHARNNMGIECRTDIFDGVEIKK